jgi:hypothetical protein
MGSTRGRNGCVRRFGFATSRWREWQAVQCGQRPDPRDAFIPGAWRRDRLGHPTVSRKVFAIKAEVGDPGARAFAFIGQKTMYGGKHVAQGDMIFVFASENEGWPGLVAVGTVTSADACPRTPGIARQTPRVDVTIRRTALAKRRLGRNELKPFSDWNDGRPETELNFKFYRQATDKIVGISDDAAAFLRGYF